MMPVSAEMMNANNTDSVEIMAFISVKLEMKLGRPIPSRTPMNPPMRDSRTASTMNWVMISLFLAPSALRSPISLVLSVTVASMIFMMPIPPTSKEMAAIEPSTILNIF